MFSEPVSPLQDCCEDKYKVLAMLLGTRKCSENISVLHVRSKALALGSFRSDRGGRGVGKECRGNA